MDKYFSIRQLATCRPQDSSIDAKMEASQALQEGLQNIFSFLAAVVCACVSEHAQAPGGFCTRFQSAFTQPTPGKLQQFLNWAFSTIKVPQIAIIGDYWTKNEQQNKGWLSQLMQLRNRWAHPQGETQDQILDVTAKVWTMVPGIFTEPSIKIGPEGKLSFISDSEELVLSPFVFFIDGVVEVPKEFVDGYNIQFRNGHPEHTKAFCSGWRQLRARDPLLEDPDAVDFYNKAEMLGFFVKPTSPWWLVTISEPGPAGMLIEPGSCESAISHLTETWPGAVRILIPSNTEPLKAVAASLGLKHPPSITAFVGFGTAEKPIVVGMEENSLDSKAFLKLLYWLLELTESSDTKHIRIFIERSMDSLKVDQEKLWDRLPSNLDSFLRKPPKSRGTGLVDFSWPSAKPRRFLGLF